MSLSTPLRPPVPVSRSPGAARPVVLYVEDHPVNVLLMQALFERRPEFELVVAGDCAEALERAVGLNPSLLMLDLGLPDGHGADLLPLLRRLRGCEHVPAVAVTADATFDIAGTGFLERWTKPLPLTALLDRVHSLVSRYRSGRADVPALLH